MNWEAIGLITVLCLLVGIILYLPFHFLVKLKIKKNPGYPRIRIKGAGFFVYGVMVVMLLVGVSMEHLVPETKFGEFIGTGLGKVIYYILVVVLFAFVEILLKRAGIYLVEKGGE